jgi:hypothetical protein
MKELYGPAVSLLQRMIAKVKQRWSVIGWVTKYLLYWVSPCFGRHVKPLAPAATINPHWARVMGYGSFSLCVIYKEGLYPSSGGINRLMMMIMMTRYIFYSVIRVRRGNPEYIHSLLKIIEKLQTWEALCVRVFRCSIILNLFETPTTSTILLFGA